MIEIKPMMETKTMIEAMRKTMNKMMVKTMIQTMIQIMLRLMVKDREPLPLLLGWWPTSKQIDDDHNCNSDDRDDEQDGIEDWAYKMTNDDQDQIQPDCPMSREISDKDL